MKLIQLVEQLVQIINLFKLTKFNRGLVFTNYQTDRYDIRTLRSNNNSLSTSINNVASGAGGYNTLACEYYGTNATNVYLSVGGGAGS
jgi:hypothetical protein